MKKTLLFSMLIQLYCIITPMEVKKLPLGDLTKEHATKIYNSLEKLAEAFSKHYNPYKEAKDPYLISLLSSQLQDLRNKTNHFPSLITIIDAIAKAIENNNSTEFWLSEETLRNFIRPAFIENPLEKKQHSYFAAALARITNAANNVYQWLFTKKQIP